MRLHCFSEQELNEYQSYVDSVEHASPYHNKAWGLAVNASYHFSMHYFGLYNAEKLVAVMPALLIKAPFGKGTLCTLPYCDFGGILGEHESDISALLEKVTEHAKSQQWHFEYRASESLQSGNKHTGEAQEFEDGSKVRMLFQLLDDVDAQMASFKPKLRSQIKKAAKNGVSTRVISKPTDADIDEFYAVFTVNMRDLGSPVHAKSWFSEVFNHYGNNAFLVLADYEHQCVGGGIVIHNQTHAVIPWASTLRNYNKKAPNMLLYWEVLSEVIRRKIPNFDFGRSTFNEGTYRFKKQWGAIPQKLSWQSFQQGELAEDIAGDKSALRAQVETLWQKMPVSMTSFIGPKIRKYISL